MTSREDTDEFLTRLRSLNISIRFDNGRMRILAPRHLLTPDLREELANRKTEILAFLGKNVKPLRDEALTIRRIPREGPLPLSSVQSRLWFLDQLNPGSTAYIFPMFARLRGPLDTVILQKTLTEIIRRHEILRSIFPAMEGVPRQVILAPSDIEIPEMDLSDLPPAEREAIALRIAADEAQRAFDLTLGPLLRAKLLRLDSEDHAFLLSVHHIVFDGSSTDIFWQDLAAIYRAYLDGHPSPLPELSVQYVDFAAWQKQSLDGPARVSHLAYWQQQLGDHPPALELPTDRPRQHNGSPGAKKTLQLESDLAASLKSLSHREGVSLSMTLLAAFSILLHRLAGQDKILVGVPTVRRNLAELERMIGMFVNTVVVLTRFSGPESVLDVLAQVREAMLDGHEHQDLPFEDLVNALDPQRDLRRTPLFQVFFNHLNMGMAPVRIPRLQIEPLGEFEAESKFDLTLYVQEQSDSIALMLVYNQQLFDESRMAILLEQYAELLKQICDDPTRLVGDLSLVTSPDTTFGRLPDPVLPLEDRWLGLAHAGFLKWAAAAPDRIAVVDPNTTWRYRELDMWSAKLACWLQARGVGPGDIVAVYAHRSAPLVLALLGILRANAAFCILDPSYPAFRLARYLRIAKPKAWLEIAPAGPPPVDLEAAIQETADDRRLQISNTPEAALAGIGIGPLEANDCDRPAYITFTSGTTSEPKSILGTHKPLSHFLDWYVRQFGLRETDRFGMLSGLAHDPLLRDVFTPLQIGGTISIPSQDYLCSPGCLFQWMQDQKITVTHLTPAMVALLARGSSGPDPRAKELSELRYAFFGGDILTSRDVAEFSQLAPHTCCFSFYGATETPQVMAWCPAGGFRSSDAATSFSTVVPIGSPIADVQLLILNAAGRLAGIGELGEIHVRTPYLSQGYINDEELTRRRFPTNPFTGKATDTLYRTGDLARYRPDGLVDFSGRADQQLKIRGYRVEPAEVEAILNSYPGVCDCAVIATEDLSGEKRLLACMVEEGHDAVNTDHLRAYLARSLPEYLIPSEFRFVASMPLTPNGKIDRRALASGKLGVRPTSPRFTPPRNQVEASIAEIWRRVLNVEKIGVFDSFFEMGGHSLAAVRLISQLRTAFRVDLPLQALFLEPTIAGLATHLEYNPATGAYQYLSNTSDWKCLVSAQTRGKRTPFFFVGGYTNPDDTLLVLSRFAPHMGPDQPVFGFRPRWVDGHGEAYACVDEAAGEFLAELRAIQPSGPYALGGYCVGGVIAVEMARQLIQSGEEISLLALLDCERPTTFRALLADLRLLYRRAAHIAEVIGGILIPNGRSRLEMIRELVRRKTGNGSPAEVPPLLDASFQRNMVAHRRLAYRHSLKEYPGRITLVVNDQQYRFDRDMGWKNVARGGLDIYRVPGDHDTILTVHGQQLGELLRRCLNEALPKPDAKMSSL
jgi:amino acid adenylation domain-containing protein